MSIKKETILISLVSLFVGVAILFSIVFFLGGEIKKNSEKIIEIRRKLIFSERESVSDIQSHFDEIKPDLEKIDSLFVDSDAPVEFIEFLEKTSTRSDIFLEINPTSLEKEENSIWEGVGFQIKAVGSSENCLRFLEKLEYSLYMTEIQSLSFSKLKKESLKSERYEEFSLGDVILNIKIKAFTK